MEEAAKTLKEYQKNIDEALNDKFLRKTLDKFAVEYRVSRDAMFKEIPGAECIQKIADTKDWCSQHLEELYEQFKSEAEKRGVIVHRAKNAKAANKLIVKIAHENEVKSIVKAKSMTAEEIMLNPVLLAENFEVVETDLGEWIIQLRGEGPSHMVMPAIHLSRYQVADDFTKVTGDKYDPEDIQRLVKVARVELRKKFNHADLGISGANFCIAENGTFAIATNEGNGRMVTTIPKTHIVIAGLDKLIPDLETALTAFTVLPRNATGQRLTASVTWITGAGECEVGKDGKKNLHIILLDNGRTKIAKDPLFSQVFRCVRCGACANVCPVYRMVGGHKMGHIYIGAIGLILTYFFHGRDKAAILAQNCIGCEACKDVCVGGIDLPELIREVRTRCLDEFGTPLKDVFASKIMKDRKRFHSFLKFIRFSQKPFASEEGYVRHLPDMLFAKHKFKSLPVLAPKSFREMWPELEYKLESPTMRVALFSGCVQDFVYPGQLEAFIKLMKAHNVQVDFPEEQNCCGLPLFMMNQNDVAKEVAENNIKVMNPKDYDAIVTLCASCASHLQHGYKKILGDDAKEFIGKTMDFSSFMLDKLGIKPELLNKSDEKVTFHAPCHQCRGLGVIEQPHELINAVAEYVPCAEEQVCCGFGGSYSAKFPEISSQILAKKVSNIKATGAVRLVTDCPGCIVQIRGGVHKAGMDVKVTHIAELLAENLKP